MAYGRLDVFWPDGQFRTYPLVDNTVSIGRSSGNTIALDTTTISRYHFTIAHDGENATIKDMESANGTFVDGDRLKNGESRSLLGGEEIQVGHLRMIYHRIDEQPTQPMMAVDETTQRIELELPAFRIDVIGIDQPFSPGAHMTAEMGITNTSEENQRYRVETSGMPPEWIRIDRPELSIDAGETAQVSVNIKPLRRPDSKPGDYTLMVRVSQKDNPEAKLEANLSIRILPYGGFGMALDARRIASGERFRLHLHNQGSAPLPLTLSGRDRGDKLRYNILAPQVTLAPGQRLSIQGEIKPKRVAWFGKPRIHPFDLIVRSNDAAHFIAAVRGQFIERPMLPSWTPFILLGLLGLGAFLLIAGAALFFSARPEPNIAAFMVNSTQVAQGEPLQVSWAVTDVRELSLNLNGTPILDRISIDTPGVNLDTNGLSGNVALALVGVNGAAQAVATQNVYIYRPLGQAVFTAEPAQLVRYVVQNLTVSWSIPGAVKTRISGLENFNSAQINATFGPDGTINDAVGIPLGPVTLTLLAEDEIGNPSQQMMEIPVINPECVPARDSVTLYAGPDTRHQVVGTVQAGIFVVVDAQDASGGWLRAQLPGGLYGWGQVSAFTCAQNFRPADLVKELTVPTIPPATLAPTNTPRPTNTPGRTQATGAQPAGTQPAVTATASG